MRVQRDIASFGEYEFTAGGSIPELEIAYETYGEYKGDNAVVLLHALTTGQHAAEAADGPPAPAVGPEAFVESTPWWDDLVGPGKPIDTDEYYVVCANAPGSCYGSSGPTTIDPETGDPYGPSFPATRIEDWTDTQQLLLERLGVGDVHAVVGGSIGGIVALDWVKRYPSSVDRVVPIAATTGLDAQSLALDALARRAILADPNWQGGRYYDGAHPDHGLALARQLGLVRYLSKETLAEQYGTGPTDREGRQAFPDGPFAAGCTDPSVVSFLDHAAAEFVTRFDANSYLSLLRALDEFDLARGYDSDAAALAAFDGEALVISFTGDWYYPVEESAAVAAAFRGSDVPVAHRVIESAYGHDTFLAKQELLGPSLRAFLSAGVPAVAGGRSGSRTAPRQGGR